MGLSPAFLPRNHPALTQISTVNRSAAQRLSEAELVLKAAALVPRVCHVGAALVLITGGWDGCRKVLCPGRGKLE